MIPLMRLLELLNARKRKILLIAEASLPETQFKAFRKLFLGEFGEKGLEGDLQKIYIKDHSNKEGYGRE